MKHRIISLAAVLVIGITCYAQSSMTDDQVIEFVKSESEKGTSQQGIVTALLKKGVSSAQLQRVRRKAEQMKASGATSTDVAKSIQVNRTEYRKEETGAESSATENVIESQDISIAETTDEEQRKVFGREIFNNKNLTFSPSNNIATPNNYIMGPGDQVIINIWGASQQTISETISPDGYIVVSGVGPIKLAGLSVGSAKSTLRSKLSQYYRDSNIDLSLGDIRSIQVQVMGEVVAPGTYTVSSLSSAFNALYMAGGINKIGTLRDIRVYRSGRLVSSVDVYDYLLNGNTRGDIRLQDNDVIVVGAYDCLVQIKGNVKRPMWYEMKKTETVKDLLNYTGGFNGNAYTKNVRLVRRSGSEYSIHTIDEFKMASFRIADEDRVEVDSIRERFSNLVEIRGAAKHAGQFQIGDDIQTVKQLIIAADGLREDAYIESAILHREKDDLTTEMVSVDVKGLLNGEAADIPLKNGDILFIPSATEMLGERNVTIFGEVAYPGQYPYADGITLRNLILQAGGMTEAGSLAKVDVYRRVRDSKATETDAINAQAFSFSLDESYNLVQDTTFTLMPFDFVMIRKAPSYRYMQNAFVRGEVNFAGPYTLLHSDYRLSDLIKACGGLTPKANVKGARLIRTMNQQELESRKQANIKSQIELYENALKSGDEMNMQIADSLIAMKQNISNTYIVSTDLQKALDNPGSNYDIILRGSDILDIPENTNLINVSGEVMFPVSMPYEKGKNLYYYINHAGGFSDNARKSKVYGVQTNGSVVRLHANSVHDIQPGIEIVVPQKKMKKKMTTGEIVGITSGIASLGAIIVALLNVLKK